MTKITIYDATDQDKKDLRSLAEDHELHFVKESLCEANVDVDAEVISVFVSSSVDAHMLERLQGLKLIACRSTGFNNIDIDGAKSHSIPVVNVPTYGERTVAEYTFALLLAMTRKIIPSASQTVTGQVDSTLVHGTDLFDKTIGIIGVGRIGQNVATFAKAFGMRVLGYDPYMDVEKAKELGIKLVDLDTLLAGSNIVTVHMPLTDENKHMFNAKTFAKMKRGSYFINTARGELMVTADLIEALQSGQLAGAGIDVLEGEKLVDLREEELLLKKGRISVELLQEAVANNVLVKIPNVIVTGHNAYNTNEAIRRINGTTAQNIARFCEGKIENQVA